MKSQSVKHLIIRAGENEPALQNMLKSLDFEEKGIQREGLYLHNAYQDVLLYQLNGNI